MQQVSEYARELYEGNKPLLKAKQKLLYRKYLTVLQKYDKQRDLLTLHQKNNIIIDDMIIYSQIGIINTEIIFSFSDGLIVEIDKDKFAKAKMLVETEILRINDIIEQMKAQKGMYKSNYTVDEIKAILPEEYGEEIIKFMSQLDDFDNNANKKSKCKIIQFPGKRAK